MRSFGYTWTIYSASCWGQLTDHRSTPIADQATLIVGDYNGCLGNASASSSVSVDITHTYIGDLVIDLIAPSGRVYNLRNRTGGSNDNLVATFPLNLSGEPMEGLWQLRIQDAAVGDAGTLNSWQLKLG